MKELSSSDLGEYSPVGPGDQVRSLFPVVNLDIVYDSFFSGKRLLYAFMVSKPNVMTDMSI